MLVGDNLQFIWRFTSLVVQWVTETGSSKTTVSQLQWGFLCFSSQLASHSFQVCCWETFIWNHCIFTYWPLSLGYSTLSLVVASFLLFGLWIFFFSPLKSTLPDSSHIYFFLLMFTYMSFKILLSTTYAKCISCRQRCGYSLITYCMY